MCSKINVMTQFISAPIQSVNFALETWRRPSVVSSALVIIIRRY